MPIQYVLRSSCIISNHVGFVYRENLCSPPSQSALPPTALPKGEPRLSYINFVGVLASPFGRGVMR
ncbi:MAG: hypothetical protein FWH14_07445 [Oscillospiraceae bacterium]|nr:hypothetical protein [Oscillospiraceae bacterium]